MSRKRASEVSPISGLRPEKLMWSSISITEPGARSSRTEPAELVRTSVPIPRSRIVSITGRITAASPFS